LKTYTNKQKNIVVKSNFILPKLIL